MPGCYQWFIYFIFNFEISVSAQIRILMSILLFGTVCLWWSLPCSLIDIWLSWCELLGIDLITGDVHWWGSYNCQKHPFQDVWKQLWTPSSGPILSSPCVVGSSCWYWVRIWITSVGRSNQVFGSLPGAWLNKESFPERSPTSNCLPLCMTFTLNSISWIDGGLVCPLGMHISFHLSISSSLGLFCWQR